MPGQAVFGCNWEPFAWGCTLHSRGSTLLLRPHPSHTGTRFTLHFTPPTLHSPFPLTPPPSPLPVTPSPSPSPSARQIPALVSAVRHVSLRVATIAVIGRPRCRRVERGFAQKLILTYFDRDHDKHALSFAQPHDFHAPTWSPSHPARPSQHIPHPSRALRALRGPASAAHSIDSLNRVKGPAVIAYKSRRTFSSG